MGQTEPSGQDAESDDVRVRAFADDRDRINALREGTERQPDVIRRVLDAYERDDRAAESLTDGLADDEVAVVGTREALVEELAAKLTEAGAGGGDTVTLEASERRAIAQEVAEVLQG